MNAPLVSLKNISRHYPSGDTVVKALDNVSIDIHAGEFVAIMGQSGSGKTTLMNIIGCLDRPTAGQYHIHNREVATLGRDDQARLRSRTFGFIYQRYNLMESATAQENVELPAIYAGVPKQERVTRAASMLNKLGLGERLGNRPSALSGGQQQRVAIARALVNDPAIILADEPTGALDSRSGEEVMTLLKQLNEEGRTVILITHDEKVASHAHRQIHIADGKVLSDTGAALSENEKILPREAEGGEPIAEIEEAVKMATRALCVNAFRTFLTLLGIIIGVASVIVMLAVGDGSKQKVLDQIAAMGTNLLMVRPGAPGIRPGSDGVSTLVAEDAAAIATLPNILTAVPERQGKYTIRRGQIDATTTVLGTNQDKPEIANWPVAEGSGLSAQDYKRMAPVAMIGQTVKKNMFPDEDPIGKILLVKNIPFEVIGVMETKGASMFGTDQDDVVFVPLSTATVRLFGRAFLSNITAQAIDVAKIEETQEDIRQLLIARHRTEDFSVRNMATFIQMATETQNTLKILLGAVAAISLLVGGIGVMNIMLVSVTERTREIGVRMATGARTKDIILQFMTEAVVVCLTGGLTGVALGILLSLLLNAFGLRAIITLPPMLLAFTCAVSTGLLFGYLPARKAAHMDPVTALASE